VSEPQRIISLDDVPLTDQGNSQSYQARIGRIGRILGAGELGARSPSCRRASAPIPSR
jgi:hypothetical protein